MSQNDHTPTTFSDAFKEFQIGKLMLIYYNPMRGDGHHSYI